MKYTELLYLSMEDVQKVGMSFSECINIVEQTLLEESKGVVELPDKQVLNPSPTSFTHAMSAHVPTLNGLGMKYISYRPGNRQVGLPDSTAMLVINDSQNMHPVCVMEAMWLTYLRTACMVAVIAKHCAKESAETVTFIGVGGLPRWVLPAIETVLPNLKLVKGFDIKQSFIDQFREDMKGRARCEIVNAASAQEALEGSDIIISATPRLADPFLKKEWWEPGSIAIPLDGGSCWERKAFEEADSLFVDGKAIFKNISDKYPGINFKGETAVFSEIISGARKGRESSENRIMIISDGVGTLDVTVGNRIYDLAKQKGIGKTLKFMNTENVLPPKLI